MRQNNADQTICNLVIWKRWPASGYSETFQPEVCQSSIEISKQHDIKSILENVQSMIVGKKFLVGN